MTIANYIFEAGMLKRVKRSGWWTERINNPESVADHSWRSAVIAMIIAGMEGLEEATTNRIAVAALLHDLHETRLLDLNKISARYIKDVEKIKIKIEEDQAQMLPKNLQNALMKSMKLSKAEYVVLKDADYLECAFQAKEYLKEERAEIWLDSAQAKLKTKSAKKLMKELKETGPQEWLNGLKKQEK